MRHCLLHHGRTALDSPRAALAPSLIEAIRLARYLGGSNAAHSFLASAPPPLCGRCSAILGKQVTTEQSANAYVHPRTGRQGDRKSQI